jgi:hypothetical protein
LPAFSGILGSGRNEYDRLTQMRKPCPFATTGPPSSLRCSPRNQVLRATRRRGESGLHVGQALLHLGQPLLEREFRLRGARRLALLGRQLRPRSCDSRELDCCWCLFVRECADRESEGHGRPGVDRAATTFVEALELQVHGFVLLMWPRVRAFGESIYLLLIGEVPSPAIGSMLEAMLVSFIDHGATPPSTLAARNTATAGAPLRACVAAGVLGFGRYHGGDIESCMHFLDEGLKKVRHGASYRDAAAQIIQQCLDADIAVPGFGHRFHTRDPRAARLFQMALELEAEAEHVQMIRAVESILSEKASENEPPLPVNIDGAIAAVCGDLGIPPSVADALFIISRVPGIAAQALEEAERHQPMRQIDPKDHVYDGPTERRLPERRK